MRKCNQLPDDEKAQLFDEWLNEGAYVGELADAYGISSTRAYQIIAERQRELGLTDDELEGLRRKRAEERTKHTYTLDPDVNEWLRQQKDVGKVLNCALRLIMEQEKQQKRMKKAK